MTSKHDPAESPNSPVISMDETLVAYLDHELSIEEQAAFEERIQHDAGLRRRRDELMATWQLLDSLETAVPDDSFTRNTISMACVSMNESRWKRAVRLHNAYVRLVVFAVSAAALIMMSMFIGGRLYRSRQLAELPLMDNVDIYLSVADIGEVRTIATTELFGVSAEDLPNGSFADASGEDVVLEEGRNVTVRATIGALRDNAEIEQVIEELSGPEREALAAKRRRFEELPAEKQSALRQLHAELFSTEDGVFFHASLTRYHDWLKSLPAGQRADLMKVSMTERLEKANEWIQQQQRRGEFATAVEWVKGDGAGFRRWWNDYLRRHGAEIAKQLPPRDNSDRERRPAENRAFREGARPEFVRRIVRSQAMGTFQLPVPTHEEFLALREELSQDALERLDKESSEWTDQFQRVARVAFLGMASQRAPLVTPDALQQFYLEELTPSQRERLDRLPADRMHFELRQFYLNRYGRRVPRNASP
jgi:hypothetical protein